MLFFIPFFIAFAVVIFSILYFQRTLFQGAENEQILTFTKKVRPLAALEIFSVFKIAGLFGFLFSIFLASVSVLGMDAATGFIFGLTSAIAVAYFLFAILTKLYMRTADKSSHGFIESFKYIFGASNILGMFVLGGAVFVIAAYYIIFGPADISDTELISLALGVVTAGFFIKLLGNLRADRKNADIDGHAKRVKAGLLRGIVSAQDIFETFFIGLIGAILAASFMLHGVEEAIALPLFIAIVGFLASAVSVKLVQISATTNIRKTVSLSLSGAVLIASIVLVALIAWMFSDGVSHTVFELWLSAFLGFLTAGLLAGWRYVEIPGINISVKRVTSIKKAVNKSALAVPAIALAVLLIYELSDFYRFALFVAGFIGMSGVFMTIGISSYVAGGVNKIVGAAELPSEQKKVAEKLVLASMGAKKVIKEFLLVSSALASLLIFLYFQKEGLREGAEEFLFSLEGPDAIAGMFISGSAILFLTYYIFSTKFRISGKNNPLFKDRGHESSVKIHKSSSFVDGGLLSLFFSVSPLILVVFILPFIVAAFTPARVFIGFLTGSFVFAIMTSLLLMLLRNADMSKGSGYVNIAKDTFGRTMLLSVVKIYVLLAFLITLILI